MELLKKLTGKNPADYEPVASDMVNGPDVSLFKELVNKDDFLFDYIKQNVAKRIFNACNESNFENLYQFLPYYSPFYDDVIISVLSKYDKQNADKTMLKLLCTGSEAEKCYATKYFASNPQQGNETILRGYIFSENEYLMANAISALKALNDETTLSLGLEKLQSKEDIDVYNGAKLICAWGDATKLGLLFEAMQNSSIPEYIGLEINSLKPFTETLDNEFAEQTALAICHILRVLGEVIPLTSVFELNLREIFEKLKNSSNESFASVVLRLAKDLFDEFAKNDEYLFDLDKNTKDEVLSIDSFLSKIPNEKLNSGILEEAFEESPFVEFIINYINDKETLLSLLEGSNQTIILSAVERLKDLGCLDDTIKQQALQTITNEDIKSIILAL